MQVTLTWQTIISLAAGIAALIALQAILAARGYSVTSVNGVFDDSTEKAVRRFQEAERLDVDGIAGPKTWARILARD